MAGSALRQQDLFDLTPSKAEYWAGRLEALYCDDSVQSGFLPIADEALVECPDDPPILLLAATAALLDHRPQRAMAILKRFSQFAKSPAQHVLMAVALAQTGQPEFARSLLYRHNLATWPTILRAFPGGRQRLPWLRQQLAGIVISTARLRVLHDRLHGGDGKPSQPTAKPQAGAKPDQRRSGASRPNNSSRSGTRERATQASAAQAPLLPPLPRIDVDIPVTMQVDLATLAAAVSRAPEREGRWFGLRERLAHLSLAQGFDELLCLQHLTGFAPLAHQTETVRKVLKQFRGRVLLADEVGLGKTIEAAMVLKEYALRGMAERVLVLTPASLVGQWREELESKFGLAFVTTYDPLAREDLEAFWNQPRIVASIATARRREHAECLHARQFDVVIVDEAHHLRDRSSASWKLVDALNKRFLLLLSATPVQNDLVELYNLLTLLKPGIFKTPKEFRAQYMTPGKPRRPANPERLRLLMRDCMVRNTRAAVALKLPPRQASTIKVEPAPGEAEAYAALAAAARRLAAQGSGAGRQRLALHHLLSAAGSSPAAAAASVARVAERNGGDSAWTGLAQRWAAIGRGGKEAALIDLLRHNPAEKKLVFVQARETLTHVAGLLAETGLPAVQFHGGMTGPDKDAAIAAFREEAAVLLCTQSGGEGRNIQFCNTLINFDVPWNPMAIEQRIGRIDRIGQERQVFVFNLVTRGTLEEQVLALLEEKIAMFELVVGEVGAILGGLEEEREFPDLVLDAWLETTEAGRAKAFDALGAQLDAARRQHEGAKALDAELFGEDFEAQ
jgi:superfamily II DNA or RNA helicase